MKIIPTQDTPRFQMFAVLFLVSILASTFISTVAFVAVLAVFCVICYAIAKGLSPGQRNQAYALFFVFSLFGLGALLANQAASSPGQALGILPLLLLGFLALYVIVKLYVVSWEAECTVIGYSEGYEIVEAGQSILSVVRPGIHAVKSRPIAKGARARLVFSRTLFGSASTPAGLARMS
jgi:hypothetical protein